MKLTAVERLIIANQHQILELIDAENADNHKLCREAIERGYLEDYYWITNTSILNEPSSDVIDVVRNTLNMFDWLQRLLGVDDGKNIPSNALFDGFDGNTEDNHFAYMEFFLQGSHGSPRYESLKWTKPKDHNSHAPMVHIYERMLTVWEDLSKDGYDHLTEEDAHKVLSVRTNHEG